MNRHLSILLVGLLLVTQAISAAHAADYGVGEHDHHGQICEFYLNAEQTNSSDVPTANVLSSSNIASFAIIWTDSPFVRQKHYSASFPRAPPHFS